jgi:hypothetical protein
MIDKIEPSEATEKPVFAPSELVELGDFAADAQASIRTGVDNGSYS